MNAGELSQHMAQRAEDIAAQLLPNGKRVASEWKAGSVDGAAGQSLSVCVAGTKAGMWKDFSTGEGGDLLDLWAACRGQSIAAAMVDVKAQLGIRDDMPKRDAKEYRKPEGNLRGYSAGDAVSQWLSERGITHDTQTAFCMGVGRREGKTYALFPYIRDGQTVNVKSRCLTDKRDMRQTSGAEPCLFGWHLIGPRERSIALCEGEIDCMTLHQLGIPALSCNAGAGNHQWLENDYERLEQFSEIFVCYDNDEAGNKGAQEVMKRLGPERCKRVVFGEHKDANDALMAGFAQWAECFEKAKTQDPDELKPIRGYFDAATALFYPPTDADHASVLRLAGIDYDWVEFPSGCVSVWTGINGHGKSLMLNQVLLGLMEQGERCVVFSGEMTGPRQAKRLIKQAAGLDRPTPEYIGAIGQWIDERMWIFDSVNPEPIPRLAEVFTYAAKRYGVTHAVIDSLMTTTVPADGPGFISKQTEAMQQIAALAGKTGLHVHLVAHPRKFGDEDDAPGKLDVGGSAVITNRADNVFSVWSARKEDDAPIDDTPDALLTLLKQRHGDQQHRKLHLYFNKGAQSYCTNARRRPYPIVQWEASRDYAHEDGPI